MAIERSTVRLEAFNVAAELPFDLRREDFQIAMQDVYDFLT